MLALGYEDCETRASRDALARLEADHRFLEGLVSENKAEALQHKSRLVMLQEEYAMKDTEHKAALALLQAEIAILKDALEQASTVIQEKE
jgi:hypothetical protein